jgi:hypothetical protein
MHFFITGASSIPDSISHQIESLVLQGASFMLWYQNGVDRYGHSETDNIL